MRPFPRMRVVRTVKSWNVMTGEVEYAPESHWYIDVCHCRYCQPWRIYAQRGRS